MDGNHFFGSLRKLAVKIDEESRALKEQMTLHKSKGKPESAALLLLELQTEMKTLHANVNKVLHDLKRNGGNFMEAVPLCQSVVVHQAEKLANIEEYLGKYGYVPPESRPSDEKNVPVTKETSVEPQNQAEPQHATNATPDTNASPIRNDEPGPAVENEHQETMQTPKAQMNRGSDSSEDRTPQPEDFGISLGNIMNKYKEREKNSPAKGSCFKMPYAPQHMPGPGALETPQNFQHRGLCVTPGLLGPNVPSDTPSGNTFTAGDRGEYSFDQQVKTLKFGCDSDGSPEMPVLRTPGFHGKTSRPENEFGQDDNTVMMLSTNNKASLKTTIASVKETDDWDNSPIPPVLTSGVVQLPRKDNTGVSKFKLSDSSEDCSPLAPVLMTPVAKQFQKKYQFNPTESVSEENSPAVPEFLTPSIKIPSHLPSNTSKYNKEKCEEGSPKFPALQSMNEDVSCMELPKNPVLSSAADFDDGDIPEPPELTTRNLQALTAQLQHMPRQDNQWSSGRNVLSEIQDPPCFPKEPKMRANTDSAQMKENGDTSDRKYFPDRLGKLNTEEYSSLSSYITRQLSMETIETMTTQVNKILFEKKNAGEAEEIHSSDINEYLGDKSKMFILVMRQLGKLQAKGKGLDMTYVVSS